MPRKPKAKNTLSAGERVALFEAEQEQKRRAMMGDSASRDEKIEETATVESGALQNEEKKPEKARVSKPKPQSATVRVDFSIPVGEIKPMHGMCNGPVSYGADISDTFREIGVPLVRFDGADTAAGGYAVDISKIFRNIDNDPSDPESYDFEYTDRYVEAAMLCGARVIFRLGESCDLLGAVNAARYDDLDLLSRVCVNIVRHFNEGWAKGHYYGIEYFELWSADEDSKASIAVYGRLANALKMHDESIKIGGMCFSDASAAREMMRACKKNRYPLDFLTLESFSGDVEQVGEVVEGLSLYAKNLGFADLELMLGKWMFADENVLDGASAEKIFKMSGASALGAKREVLLAQRSVKGAAYSAALMLRLCGIDGATSACHFDAQPAISPFCSLTDSFGRVEKPFYSFRAFGELYRAKNAVLCSVDRQDGFAHSGIYASAALSDSGEGIVMLASFGGCGVIDLRLDGIAENHYSADVYMMDGVKNMELADSVPLSGMKKRLLLNVSEYGVILIKLH